MRHHEELVGDDRFDDRVESIFAGGNHCVEL